MESESLLPATRKSSPGIVRSIAIAFLIAFTTAGTLRAAAPPNTTATATAPWWKHAVIYEIYPRSFQDTNGDGVGDINGITRRLGYLRALGVDAIWLTPIYPSPNVDFGYDISDYEAIDPLYGSMADFDRMMLAAKRHNIRIIMDMVMNHTSDQSAWFKESRSSRTSPKRNWYVWRDGKGPGIPPNNWLSDFGHSAWTYDDTTQQWYYHKFYSAQPDLNWNNPEVQKAMFDVCRFWLNKGVAGFRLDAIPELFEDPQFRDEKVLPGKSDLGDPNQGEQMTSNLPQVHRVMRDLRRLVDSYPGDRVLIGETYLNSIQDQRAWYGAHNDELQLPMDMQPSFINKMDVAQFRTKLNEAETQLNGNMPLFVFDNHDSIRSWNRYADGKHDAAIARILATILLTTRSTALLYQGQELGMVTSNPTKLADVQDPVGRVGWPRYKGRDGERTPMQWEAAKNAGFSTAEKTWLPIPDNYKTVNVATEWTDSNSLLSWYRRLISLRVSNPAMQNGTNIMVDTTNPNVLSYVRKNLWDGPSVLVAMNFTDQPRTVSYHLEPQGIHGNRATALAVTGGVDKEINLDKVVLPPFAVFIGSIQ